MEILMYWATNRGTKWYRLGAQEKMELRADQVSDVIKQSSFYTCCLYSLQWGHTWNRIDQNREIVIADLFGTDKQQHSSMVTDGYLSYMYEGVEGAGLGEG